MRGSRQGQQRRKTVASRSLYALSVSVVFVIGCADQDRKPRAVVQTKAQSSEHEASCKSANQGEGVAAVINGSTAEAAIPNHVFIDGSTLAKLCKEAALGDPAAAELVADHYSFLQPYGDAREFWDDVALENGSRVLMDYRAQVLWEKGGQYRCLRAEYWFRRIIAADPASASEYHEKIKAMKADPLCQKP